MEAKQELLELRSENARLRLLAMLLRAAIERLELIERAQARAHPTARSASAQRSRARSLGQAADLLRGLQHEQRQLAQNTAGWPAESSLKLTDAVFVAHAVAEHRSWRPASARCAWRRVRARSSWIARA